MAGELKNFYGLLIFGNIENLVLASQGVAASVNPVILAILSLIAVICWFLLGTFGTRFAMKYANYINFIGGLAIFILGVKSMIEAIPGIINLLH